LGYAQDQGDLTIQVYDDISAQANGVNVNFTTTANYYTGTLTVLNNGVKIDDDDISETGANTFDLASAPTGRLEVYHHPSDTFSVGEPNLDRVTLFTQGKKLEIPEIDNVLLLTDTTSGSVQHTLPNVGSTEDGIRCRFKNIGVNNLTIARHPSAAYTISLSVSPFLIDVVESCYEFVYVHADLDFVQISGEFAEAPSEAPPNVVETSLETPPDTSGGSADGNLSDPQTVVETTSQAPPDTSGGSTDGNINDPQTTVEATSQSPPDTSGGSTDGNLNDTPTVVEMQTTELLTTITEA
jgi:hypothetical protein